MKVSTSPWTASHAGTSVTSSDNVVVCVMGVHSTEDDARLIAAAPELLAALKGLLDTGLVREFDVPENHAAIVAIAKAEGR